MQLSGQHIAGGIGLVVAAMVAWFAGLWLDLQGANLWFVRLCIFLLLGLVVLAVAWWLGNRKKNKPSAEASPAYEGPVAGATDDIQLILREAEGRIASSTQLARGTRLSSLPVIFLVGGTSSGKTCVATQSGLDPELISGQVYQEGNIAPTRLANLWFARKAVFVEMGGKILGDAAVWSRVLHRIAPGKLRAIFSSKPAAPRAAVVCYDSTRLAKAATPEEIVAEARGLRARLEQISQTLGISFPVYALFTQADRLPYFDDFFRNLSDSEITQVLGVTLPPLPATASGVYAEQETKRITSAFNSMFYSLAECRPGLLYRERNAERLPAIYEFPRELQKRIPLATEFLVDLCRPSHLRSGPFLRGFYFTGVRQVETAAPLGGTMIASKTSVMAARAFSADATSIMRAEDFTRTQTQGWQTATQTGLAPDAGKTTQWLFLSHIFSHVILQDRIALGASGSSSRANVWKRALLATCGAVAAIWLVGMIFSFVGNHRLERAVRTAAEGIDPIKYQSLSEASLDQLQSLDRARAQLEKLTDYHLHGAPLWLHWGLYSGELLYQDFRPLYFNRFKKLLFGEVQVQMASHLRGLPASPANPSDDDYGSTHDTLKAYLMTTRNPDRSDTPFLSDFLLSKWAVGLDSEDHKRLAREQFTFYADQLRIENPFSDDSDPLVTQAIEQGRRYLIAFTGANFVYNAYLAKLRSSCKECQPLDFSKKYADAAGIVLEPKVVDKAFTKEGWKFMEGLISRNDWNTDDEWVLGPDAKEAKAHGVNTGDVQRAYESDYIREWRGYVKSASVVALGGPTDASKKLEKLAENRSPLFELLCEVSENTDKTSPLIAAAFLPVTDVVKAPCYKLVSQEPTKPYVSALSDFRVCIDRYQENPKDPATQREDYYKSCKTQQMPVVRREAANVVKSVDHEADLDKCVVSLLKFEACGKIAVPPPSDVFCAALNRLSMKYPFRPDSNDDASLEEFDGFFRPMTGVLSREIANGGKSGPHADLLRVAQNIQNSLYPNGSSTLQYRFAISATVPAGLKSVQLALDGTALTVEEGSSKPPQPFLWPGKAHEAELKLGDSKYLGPLSGTWAVFRLLSIYSWSAGKGGFHLESPSWKSPQGLAFKDYLELNSEGPPIFRRGYLSQLRCRR